MRAVSRCQLTWEAENRLVICFKNVAMTSISSHPPTKYDELLTLPVFVD